MKRIKTFNLFNEGKAYNATKQKNKREEWDSDPKESFREKVKSHIRSQDGKTKQIGNDLEVYLDDKYIAQVMFREDHMEVEKADAKFADEFKYTEYGKVKSKLSEIIKSFK